MTISHSGLLFWATLYMRASYAIFAFYVRDIA